jgi:hypothetical protein
MGRVIRRLLATSGTLAMLAGLTPVARAATLIADGTNPATNLQTVINSANPGDTVVVIGTCKG